MIIAQCWTAWHERNQFVFQSKVQDPNFLVAKAEATVAAYERVKMSKMKTAVKASLEEFSRVQNLTQRYFKVNVDAAINRDAHKGGLGVMIRDGNKNIVAAAIKQTLFYWRCGTGGSCSSKMGYSSGH